MSDDTVRQELADLFAEQVRCPDCDSDAELVQRLPGVFELTIAHDETCPTWRMLRERKEPA